MVKISLLFVGKFTNIPLLVSLPASISKMLPHFSFATDSCKGLTLEKDYFSKNRRQFLAVGGLLSLLPYTTELSAKSQACHQIKPSVRWKTGNSRLSPFLLTDNFLYCTGEATLECWNSHSGTRVWQQPLDKPSVFRSRL